MIEVKERESFLMASVRASVVDVKERESFMMKRGRSVVRSSSAAVRYSDDHSKTLRAAGRVRSTAAGRVRIKWMSLIPEACASRAARLILVHPLMATAMACRLQRRILRVYQ